MATNRRTPSQLARVWKTTNAPDYVGLLVIVVTWVMIIVFVKPFHRYFFVKDLNISFPHAEVERVPVLWNVIYALFIPLGLLIAFNSLARSTPQKHEATYLSFAISVALTSLLTDILKNAVGRPRPDLLARCIPAASAPIDRPVDISVCTAPDGHRLQDGWRSFPSGHSSFSFAGLGFTALFLAGQLGAFRLGTRDLGRTLICFAPLVGATLIAISRCEDYRHDVYDVCTGSALGMTVAYWSYRRHWPRLSSSCCDVPYPPPGKDEREWQRIRDEERGSEVGGYEMQVLPEES